MELKTKKFLIQNLKLGDKTRVDTLIILSYLYDEVIEKGINDEVVGQYLYIRDYLDQHRELIDNKTYSIISIKTALDRLNLIVKENVEVLEEKKIKYEENIENIKKIKPKAELNLENIKRFGLMTIKMAASIKKEEKNNSISNHIGIYGIYVDNRLVYIGRATVSFQERFNSHLRNIKESKEWKYVKLRKYKDAGAIITLKPIIDLNVLEVENKRTYNKTEINCMEFALITAYQPELNTEGRTKPYVFRNY